jgi:hypothetical protein
MNEVISRKWSLSMKKKPLAFLDNNNNNKRVFFSPGVRVIAAAGAEPVTGIG